MPLSRASASIRSIRRWNAKWSWWISMVRCLAIFRLFSTAPSARQSRRHCTAASACGGPAAGMRASSRSVAASSSIHRADKAQLGATIIATTRWQYRRDAASFRRAQDQPVQRDPAQHPERRRHMAMRQRALDLHLLRPGTDRRAALQQRLQTIDHITRQLAQVGQCALLRAASFVAITLPQQHRRRRRPIGHRLDEPGRIGSHPGRFGNPYMDTKSAPR